MSNLFKKAAMFTDLHLGLKGNSTVHNQDCEAFIDWFIATAKSQGCETGFFLGDFHHNRNTLNITTMDFSIRILEKLGAAFSQFFFFPGNHDLYYKDKRDIHSVEFGKHIPGVEIVRSPITIGDTTICPWLVGDEWKSLQKVNSRYIFGHFEFPHFFMNAMVQMPDHGELQLSQFKQFEYVFSGHFHKRQQKNNVVYIGNAFPHNYADAWDDARGMTVLEWGGQPEFHSWPAQPTYRTTNLSTLIDKADTLLLPNQYLRVSLDIDISFEEAAFIKEKFLEDYMIRELTLIPESKDPGVETTETVEKFESIDQIVNSQIANIESETFDTKTLLAIYNNL
jgi:DNA repair exonuclease SbcCD nuclease subunit